MFDHTAAQWLSELADDMMPTADGADANAWVAVWEEKQPSYTDDSAAPTPVTAYYAAAFQQDANWYGA
jgi:hypothetical protein